MKEKWGNIAVFCSQKTICNCQIKIRFCSFPTCAWQLYKTYMFWMVTDGSYWHHCNPVTEMIDNHFTTLCYGFITASIGSDCRVDDFMQWTKGKWTFLHSFCPINKADYPFYITFFFLSIIIFSLHLFHHSFISCIQSQMHIKVLSNCLSACCFIYFFVYFSLLLFTTLSESLPLLQGFLHVLVHPLSFLSITLPLPPYHHSFLIHFLLGPLWTFFPLKYDAKKPEIIK